MMLFIIRELRQLIKTGKTVRFCEQDGQSVRNRGPMLSIWKDLLAAVRA